MPKLTLLDMVQRTLSSMDSDMVNSFDDTIESEQVAYIIRDVYFDLINNIEIPEHRKLVTLTALGVTATPTHMKIPDGVKRLEEVRYNVIKSGGSDKDYSIISYVEPQVFLQRTLSRSSSDSDVVSVTIDGGEALIRKDKAPEFYTSFDDEFLIFDSYDSDVDSTLQSSKFIVWAVQEPTFTMANTFTPDLDVNVFPLLLNEVKSVAHVELNQQANPKAEQMALKQKIRWQSDRHNVSESAYNSYGRSNYGRANRRRA
tara:strand:- start:5205 stop:5978 length:774 start_codon:yes stop_codon:yes gene_type:complete